MDALTPNVAAAVAERAAPASAPAADRRAENSFAQRLRQRLEAHTARAAAPPESLAASSAQADAASAAQEMLSSAAASGPEVDGDADQVPDSLPADVLAQWVAGQPRAQPASQPSPAGSDLRATAANQVGSVNAASDSSPQGIARSGAAREPAMLVGTEPAAASLRPVGGSAMSTAVAASSGHSAAPKGGTGGPLPAVMATSVQSEPKDALTDGGFAASSAPSGPNVSSATVPVVPAATQATISPIVEPASAASEPPSPVPEATLAQPLHHEGGLEAFALRVTQFTREGISEARLHLNPSDMGPVNVHIALDGALARIDFEAAHAQTRALIENSLPVLASALHAGGLTLAGGSVNDHTRRDRSGDAQRFSPGAMPAPHAGAGIVMQATAAPGRSAARGLLDLYA